MYTSQQHEIVNHQIYALRYAAYLDNDSIDPMPDRSFMDEFDGRENCHSHIEHINGLPAGSIRACIYDPARPDLPVPAMEVYPRELGQYIAQGHSFVESNKFVIHPSFQHRMTRIKLALFRFIFTQAQTFRSDYIVTAVRPEHADFYRTMCFEPISEVKQYSHLKFSTVLLSCPIAQAMDNMETVPEYRAVLRRFHLS